MVEAEAGMNRPHEQETKMDVARRLWPHDPQDSWMKDEFVQGLVSVIIPTYNRSSLLLETLSAVQRQTYRPVEIITVDDGSTDRTRELVGQWYDECDGKDTLSFCYLCQPKAGACAARNRGLIESSGEYIQFLDSDDILHPQKIEKQSGFLIADKALDFVYSPSGFFTDKPDWNVAPYCGTFVPQERMLREFLFCTNSLWNTESGLYRRRVCVANGPWDESLARFQDWEYNIRLLLLDANVAHMPGLFSLARLHNDERICGSPMDASKIREILAAVGAVARRIDMVGLLSREVRSGLAFRYLCYTQVALMEGLTDVAREGVAAGMAMHGSLWDTVNFMVCRAVLSLPRSFVPPVTRCYVRNLARCNRVSRMMGFNRCKPFHRQ